MNILILTGRFGMGHYSVAEAIKQEILLEEPDAKIDIVDMIDYMFPSFSNGVYKSFDFMVSKCSGIYNLLNTITGKFSRIPLEKTAMKKIEGLLCECNVSFVIATLPVCAQYISAYKTMKHCDIPLYTYITDITVHEEWIAKNTDQYFVSSSMTKNTLVAKGVSSEKICICGIPVKQQFKSASPSKCMTKKKEVLIMGGGLGLIPYSDTLLKTLSEKEFLHVTLIAGKNKKVFCKVKERFPQIDIIGYTDKVHEYMMKADLVITKPGGITTFEAIYCESPLYIIKPFLMQEVGNAKFIEGLNIGKVLWTEKTTPINDVLTLLENELLLETMRNNMKKIRESTQISSPLSIYYRNGADL